MAGNFFIKSFIFLLQLLILFSANAADRRRDQFPTGKIAQGHFIVPAPYSLKGIGSGIAVAGSITNVAGSYSDLGAFVLTGDIEGYGVGLSDNHIIKKSVIVDVFKSQLNKIKVNSYGSRGMSSSDDNYTILGLENVTTDYLRIIKTNVKRDLELSLSIINSKGRLLNQFDKDGDLITELNSDFNVSDNYLLGLRLDKTDDFYDPRKGHLFKASINKNGKNNNFVRLDTSYSHYLSVKPIHTWVNHLYYSESLILNKPNISRADTVEDLDVDCDTLQGDKLEDCNNLVEARHAQSNFGDSTSLGGRGRLRAFPNDRFQGSKTIFFGSEFRWNFSNIMEFFDIYLAQGTKNNYQFAVFGETGSVVDEKSKLFDQFRSDVGFGFRIVLGSGFVFRLDLASEVDGNNSAFTAIVGYPWDSLN